MYGADGGAGGGSGPGGCPGSGTVGTPGVPIWLAIHGNADANACAANGQSCLPGWVTTAHLMPLALPNPHSELAAAVWSVALTELVSNQPVTPV